MSIPVFSNTNSPNVESEMGPLFSLNSVSNRRMLSVRADYVLSSPQVAGESEVSAVVSSAMLASDDVLNVIGKERLRILRQATVFAAITSPFADSLPEPLVHQAA